MSKPLYFAASQPDQHEIQPVAWLESDWGLSGFNNSSRWHNDFDNYRCLKLDESKTQGLNPVTVSKFNKLCDYAQFAYQYMSNDTFFAKSYYLSLENPEAVLTIEREKHKKEVAAQPFQSIRNLFNPKVLVEEERKKNTQLQTEFNKFLQTAEKIKSGYFSEMHAVHKWYEANTPLIGNILSEYRKALVSGREEAPQDFELDGQRISGNVQKGAHSVMKILDGKYNRYDAAMKRLRDYPEIARQNLYLARNQDQSSERHPL